MSDFNEAYNAAIRILALRENSRTELRRKLAAKSIDTRIIEDVINQLEEQGLISEQRYIDMMVRSALSKGHGPRRISQQLQQNGIDSRLISTVLDAPENDWWSLAYDVKCRKFGEQIEADWKLKQKQQRFLANRGFTLDQINYAIHAEPESDA